MIILGIETSCDETAAAIVEDGTKILSNTVASSVSLHQKTGGIIPEVAAREQIKCIIPVIEETIKQSSNITINNIDALAVTVGPGLIGSLLVGVETARTLAYVWKKPLIPVNHLVAHIYANWLANSTKRSDQPSPPSEAIPHFPLVALVVSGGHTDLVLIKNHSEIQWIGGTRDDAAGECFDKCARVLGLGYPGGPAISAEAEKYQTLNIKNQIKLPRPMINNKNFDFSFSGLKTAGINEIRKLKSNQQYNNLTIQQLSYEIQEAITDVLVTKTLRAAEKYKVKSVLLSGGVAANSRLREKFSSHPLITNYQLLIPPPSLCTDNAAMVASVAYFNYKPIPWQKITTQPGLTIIGEE